MPDYRSCQVGARRVLLLLLAALLSCGTEASASSMQLEDKALAGSQLCAQLDPKLTLAGGRYPFKLTVAAREGLNDPAWHTERYSSNKLQTLIDTFSRIGEGGEHNFSSVSDWKTADIQASALLRGLPVSIQVSVERSDMAQHMATRVLTFKFNGESKVFRDQVQLPHRAMQYALSAKQQLTASTATLSVYQQLENWLQGKGGDQTVLKDLADSFVKDTAIDPVAGNPNSLMSMMTAQNFNINQQLVLNGDPSGLDLFSIQPAYSGYTATTEVPAINTPGTATIPGYNAKNNEQSLYLPLQYAHYFNAANALSIDIPFNYNITDQSSTYSLTFGLSYMHTMLARQHWRWALTPHLHTGAVVSIDLGSGTPLISSGLGSRLLYHAASGRWSAGLTDVFDYIHTLSVKLGDIDTPYKFYNVTTENGLDYDFHYSPKVDLGVYYKRFDVISGLPWYISGYNALGFKLARITHYRSELNHPMASYEQMALSVGYIFAGQHYQGYQLALAFNF